MSTNLEDLGSKVNYYTMIVVNNKGHVKILYQAPTNDKKVRVRPEGAEKFTTFILQTQTDKPAFAVNLGGFGKLWVRNYKVEELKKEGRE